jgi:hypothetical protein
MKFVNTMEGYENWRKAVESEVMWHQREHSRNIWKVGDKIVADYNGHAINHCGYKLLQAALEQVDFDLISPKEVVEITVWFDKPVGYQECVKTSESDCIVYLQRAARANVSRFVLYRQPEPCQSVFLVLGRVGDTNKYIFRTAFVGEKSAREPWDRNATISDVEFWREHALVTHNDISIHDDLGDVGYWAPSSSL